MAKERFRAVDLAKGIGIILVVLGHSLKQTEADAKWIRVLVCLIYSFHMPLFFMLSGFLARKILRMGTYRERLLYIRDRAVRLLIPYFVIGLFYIPVKLKLSAYAVKPFTLRDSLKLLIGQNPDVSLWFLYVLFVISAICALCVNESSFRDILYGSAALCAASWWVNIPVNTPKYLFFFLAGIWLRLKYEDLQKEGSRYLFEGQGLPAFLALILFLIFNRIYFHNGVNIFRLGSSICGIYVTLWLCEDMLKRADGSRLVHILEMTGLMSMDIYILHEPLMTAAKILFWNKLALPYPAATLFIFLFAMLLPCPISKGIVRRVPLLEFLFFGEKNSDRRALD